jgi:RNA polymerase-binding protein DksA
MADIPQSELMKIEFGLRKTRSELLEEIHDLLLDTGEEAFIKMADQVHDRAEESVADILADLAVETIQQRVDIVSDIEAALQRIDRGTYGDCIDCGDPIDKKRLAAKPQASRCVECQGHFERESSRT